MSLDTIYNYAPTSPVQITREEHVAVGSGDVQLGTAARAFKGLTDFEIWDSPAGGTQLTEGTDYELRFQDDVLTADAGYSVYARYKILNATYQIGSIYITYKIVRSYNDADYLNKVMSDLAALSAIVTPLLALKDASVRHTVLSGLTDASGYATFLSESSGEVSIDTNAGVTDFVATWADGFGSIGAVNYVSVISADTTPAAGAWDVSGESDGDYYLYIDNDGAGVLTYGYTDQLPVYGYAKPAASTADAHYFVIPEMIMYSDSGAAWTAVNRLFVGEINKAGAVYTTVSYAIRGVSEYISSSFAANTTYNINHLIGCENIEFQVFVANATDGWSGGRQIWTSSLNGTLIGNITHTLIVYRYGIVLNYPNASTGGDLIATQFKINCKRSF